ncbi:MAG: hypothetical protein ACKO96_27145, partial [Flammeovirgaceae bacterium]
MTLTLDEIKKIGEWKPYRQVWDFNHIFSTEDETEIEQHYKKISYAFTDNIHFDCIESQDGGLTNYLEYLCYKPKSSGLEIESIVVYINLNAPIATYGQARMFIQGKDFGLTHPRVNDLGQIKNDSLKEIETEIKSILTRHGIINLDKEFLEKELADGLKIKENLLDGDRLFNYLSKFIIPCLVRIDLISVSISLRLSFLICPKSFTLG